jgi:acetyl esterase/lipase
VENLRPPFVGEQMPRSQRISLRHSISGWRSLIAASDAAVTPMALARAAKVACEVQHTEVEGARVYVVTPSNTNTDHKRVFLDIHGGGFIMGSGECCRAMAIATAARVGARVWSVDYRMPPDHPYPAGLDTLHRHAQPIKSIWIYPLARDFQRKLCSG